MLTFHPFAGQKKGKPLLSFITFVSLFWLKKKASVSEVALLKTLVSQITKVFFVFFSVFLYLFHAQLTQMGMKLQ